MAREDRTPVKKWVWSRKAIITHYRPAQRLKRVLQLKTLLLFYVLMESVQIKHTYNF